MPNVGLCFRLSTVISRLFESARASAISVLATATTLEGLDPDVGGGGRGRHHFTFTKHLHSPQAVRKDKLLALCLYCAVMKNELKFLLHNCCTIGV